MTASRGLAAQRGISEETCKQIDYVHECIDEFINTALLISWPDDFVKDCLAIYEEELQRLWNFPVDLDPRFHTYFDKYLFKKQWYNRSFRCNSTGQEFRVPMSVQECQFFQWGQAYLDTGRLNSYSRMSNCTEIVSEDPKVEKE